MWTAEFKMYQEDQRMELCSLVVSEARKINERSLLGANAADDATQASLDEILKKGMKYMSKDTAEKISQVLKDVKVAQN